MNPLPHAAIDVGSRNIRDVRPLQLGPGQERGTWACTRCGREHPVATSYAVEFGSSGRLFQFVVCADCADLYQVPGPVRLDLRRLSPSDAADPGLETVTDHVRFVAAARRRPPERVVELRDADVRQLALRIRETPSRLVRRLGEEGLLVTA